ncbi:DUF2171 domain-containing protein [Ktedonospora formicarum]|uniref:DUF2171 domain-containing protein n=1 Tax=Ktedonospora formicarum TaxID=2778364 RepID=A0A8J3MXI4_9CHLR|nr:DUF2171 domain-containing protein [Ktedonospora formicarum]GHO50021.1 hypothetical protein KSX_81840 [Ktedonospora formicarum]
MTQWTPDMIHKGMEVYSSENEDLGHVEEVYEDSFLVQKGLIFHKDRYVPYGTISSINDERVTLMISKAEAKEMHWEERPAKLESDPTQIFYDRGHESPRPLNTPHI